jgi:hypothetical protein
MLLLGGIKMKTEKKYEKKNYHMSIECYEKVLEKTNKKAIDLYDRSSFNERVKKLKWPMVMI